MKKMNKKGFTLIELLAVIVILAIIMVIAVPQILSVIENSRSSAWDDNVKMIEKAIETNEALLGTGQASASGAESVFKSGNCTQTNIAKIADLGTDTTITPKTQTTTTCAFNVEGSGQFAGRTTKSITCTASGCTIGNAITP